MNFQMTSHSTADQRKENLMLHKKTSIIVLICILLIPLLGLSQNIPARPSPPQLVNDLADVLNSREEQALELKLRYFNDTTSNQIVVVTVNSLEGSDPAMFAFEIGEKWGVGQKEFDNGIVVLVKPKRSERDKGRAYIAVGYGLEPAIPDAIGKRIVDNEMIPSFQNNNYYQGLDKGTDVLMALAAGEITAQGYNEQTKRSPLAGWVPIIAVLIIVLIIRGGRNRSRTIGRGSSVPFWTALWLGSSLGGRSHSGSWNNFTGGGSGFGGGFGGFGGGSFGGGGAGGSW
jgi:uncharacterized protein